MFGNWWKLVSLLKNFVLFLRKPKLCDVKQNEKYPYAKQINVADANVAQIITRFGYSLFGKAKKWFNQGREGRPHATVADWNALKEQFKQQFNPVGNTREETLDSWEKYY